MKKSLLKFAISTLTLFVLLSLNHTNAQSIPGVPINLPIGSIGSYNLDSLNSLSNSFVNFQKLTDSLNSVVLKTLADTSTQKQIESLSSAIALIQTNQDSIVKIIADSAKISKDSLTKLETQVANLQNKQDSLSNVLSSQTNTNIDSLLAVAQKLDSIQNKTDSLKQVFLTNVANYTTFNQDSLDKAKAQLAMLQQSLTEAVKNTTGIVNDSAFSFSLFPNPTVDYFSITSPSYIKSVTIYNYSGEQINSFKASDKYNVSNLKSGIYLINIELENEVKIVKLLVQ